MNKKENETKVGIWDKIKKIYQSKPVKMTLFFGFYFFFFLFLVSFIRNNNTNLNNNSDETNNDKNNIPLKEENGLFYTEPIINNNYYYEYQILEDNEEIVFQGNINDINDSLNKYENHYFLNIYNIRQLIKNAKFLSKTTHQDNSIEYNYELLTGKIKEIKQETSTETEGINSIVVTVNKDLIVTNIKLDLSDYMQKNNKYTNYNITLKYSEVKNEESNTN